MNAKTRKTKVKTRKGNLPIPLLLFTSYIAAEKSEELIKGFCKELPSILQNINDNKKALADKTKTVYKLKEEITQDLNKLELAKIVLKELYEEEESLKLDKEKELQRLHSEIATSQQSKKILNNFLNLYSKSREALNSVAEESNQFNNATELIRSYLTLQDMNEKLIEQEYKCLNIFKEDKKNRLEDEKQLMNLRYDMTVREKKLEILMNEYDSLKNINYHTRQSIREISQKRTEEHLEGLQIKRWAYDISLKIPNYKENAVRTEDFIRLLDEIKEFIEFANVIILKLKTISEHSNFSRK